MPRSDSRSDKSFACVLCLVPFTLGGRDRWVALCCLTHTVPTSGGVLTNSVPQVVVDVVVVHVDLVRVVKKCKSVAAVVVHLVLGEPPGKRKYRAHKRDSIVPKKTFCRAKAGGPADQAQASKRAQ